ncbi:TRAP transporter small permease [Cognatishimia sp. F0-27]|uniref:TRAP transporter small permease n=1 Tax=Cognatishimia sp. F0-27 TaxID=2816855 RepID=UPI001D0C3FA6|nr:TRAP transporter small permease [Cognatishimia sp. F0-27]MCC1491511.1 TRAP transporter small permease [Cognatishimia sp. F0-27]
MIRLTRGFAGLGGVVLLGLIVLVCLSVAGRAINTWLHGDWITAVAPGFAEWVLASGVGAIRGDFELVEAGIAFCIFAFIPYCQVTAGHASVDILTNAFAPVVQRLVVFAAEALFAVALVVIAVQLESGMASKIRSGQQTMLLQLPIWWGYAASLVGASLAAAAGVYMAGIRFYELLSGRDVVGSGLTAAEDVA